MSASSHDRAREPTFTTARVTGGVVVWRALHRERLLRDGGDPALVGRLLDAADAKAAALHEGMVRVIVGSDDETSRVEAGPARRRPWTAADPPMSLLLRPDPRVGDALRQKTLERSALTALDEEARALGADGVLLTGPGGELREGTWFSFVLLLGGHWHAPPLGDGVLYSTTRAALQRALAASGEGLVERPLTFADLQRADGAAALSALLGASAVWRVGAVPLPTDASRVERLLVCSGAPNPIRG